MAKTIEQRDVAATVAKSMTARRAFNFAPYLFILPHLIFFGIFVGYPFFSGLYYSFFDYSYLRPEAQRFIGIGNYTSLFDSTDVNAQRFWKGLTNTGLFVLISVPFLIALPLGLAVLLNTKLPGRNFFRAIFFSPWVLSVAVVSLLWWWVFQSNGGLVNYYLKSWGVEEIPRWLSSQPWAWIAILVCTVWWTMGFNMIILLAALQEIPEQLYEAATIDGANPLQMFLKITLPLLQSVLVFIITISIISSFNLFGQPLLMTNGGPGDSTQPIMLLIYQEGFGRFNQGMAAAMSFVVATIMIVVSYVNFKFLRNKEA